MDEPIREGDSLSSILINVIMGKIIKKNPWRQEQKIHH